MVRQSWIIASMSSNNRISKTKINFHRRWVSLSLLWKLGLQVPFRIFKIKISLSLLEIRCHSDKNFQYQHQRHQWSPPPPFIFFVVVSSYFSMFESFPIYFCWILARMRSPSALSFVCLFACIFCDNSRTLQQIITKLYPYVYLGTVQKPIVFLGQKSNN